MFKEAGISGPPQNWDEIVTYGKKLTKKSLLR
jgi:ABC-type glycerol-3-phosphate transport system substrate-binding protein